MKKEKRVSVTQVFVIALLCLFAATVWSQPPDYKKIAANIVKNIAQVKPGEQVLVNGGRHLIDLLEAIVIETNKCGGKPVLLINSDKIEYSYVRDVNPEYLKLPGKILPSLADKVDVYIILPTVEDEAKVYKDVPQEKLNTIQESQIEFYNSLNASKIRTVYVHIPKEDQSKMNDIPFPEFSNMMWSALSADNKPLIDKAQKVNNVIMNGKTVKITTPEGTNFTFNLPAKPCILQDGSFNPEKLNSKRFSDRCVTIPAGTVGFLPQSNSANGIIVLPNDLCNYTRITNVKFTVKDGAFTNVESADGKECLNKVLKDYTINDKTLGSMGIGINPLIKKGGKNAGLPLWESEGTVAFSFGGNITLGGTNDAKNGYWFSLPNATLEVDGKVIIRNGKLEI